MKEKIRIGLMGCGWISESHIAGVKILFEKGCDEFEVAACCDLNPEQAGKAADSVAKFQKNRPAVFTDMEKMIEAGVIDCVDICLPHYLHHKTGSVFLENGCHVMVEKPFSITLKSGRKLLEEANKKGCVISVAENIRRYLPARAMEWAINEKKIIGNVNLALIQVLSHRPFDYNNPAFKWRGIKLLSGGGMIFDSGHHLADMMLYLFGQPETVSCHAGVFDKTVIKNAPVIGDKQADVEDFWSAEFIFKSGLVVNWVYSRSFPGAEVNQGIYFGDKGSIKDKSFVFHCFQNGGDVTLSDGTVVSSGDIEKEYLENLSTEEKERLFPYGCYDGFGVEIIDFVRAIRNKGKPEIDGEEGLRIMALCETCYESDRLKQPVKYEDVHSSKICSYQQEINDYWQI